ncbi:MAG: hypothetical protein HOI49_02435 [Bacteroidetes bacterium]|nr:hypothetical protein [Bacteroidota bacterium]
MKLIQLTILCFGLLSMMVSCSPEANNSKEFSIDTVLTASGPLFEGSNTCQAEISSNIAEYIKENGISKEQIVDITLKSAAASIDTSNLNLVESINLQVFSDNFPMQNVAFANVEEGSQIVQLEVADVQEQLKAILFDGKSYIIADATIKEDLDDDLNLPMNLNFSINYHK